MGGRCKKTNKQANLRAIYMYRSSAFVVSQSCSAVHSNYIELITTSFPGTTMHRLISYSQTDL